MMGNHRPTATDQIVGAQMDALVCLATEERQLKAAYRTVRECEAEIRRANRIAEQREAA